MQFLPEIVVRWGSRLLKKIKSRVLLEIKDTIDIVTHSKST